MAVDDNLKELIVEPAPSNTFQKIGKFIIGHLADSTAILMAMTPIYMLVELVILQMTPSVSFVARLTVMAITYAGTGLLVAKGRDLSKSFFGLKKTGVAERKIIIHDLAFLVGFNAIFGPIIYLVSRASWSELIWGTLFAMGLSFFTGPVNGFFIDAVGELTELRQSDRLPESMRQLGRPVKLAIFGACLALWVAGFVLVYRQDIF